MSLGPISRFAINRFDDVENGCLPTLSHDGEHSSVRLLDGEVIGRADRHFQRTERLLSRRHHPSPGL
jgi:hypothetical protein